MASDDAPARDDAALHGARSTRDVLAAAAALAVHALVFVAVARSDVRPRWEREPRAPVTMEIVEVTPPPVEEPAPEEEPEPRAPPEPVVEPLVEPPRARAPVEDTPREPPPAVDE